MQNFIILKEEKKLQLNSLQFPWNGYRQLRQQGRRTSAKLCCNHTFTFLSSFHGGVTWMELNAGQNKYQYSTQMRLGCTVKKWPERSGKMQLRTSSPKLWQHWLSKVVQSLLMWGKAVLLRKSKNLKSHPVAFPKMAHSTSLHGHFYSARCRKSVLKNIKWCDTKVWDESPVHFASE